MQKYNHRQIEKKWQRFSEVKKLHQAKLDQKKKKFYALIEFPYPSGEGLHVGHIRSNTAMDVIARKRRAEGFNVLYPIGWDAFGLPTENYAIKTGIHPKIVTKKNTDNFRKQLKALGFSFDWTREINTTDPNYYKWTQWIFLKLFEKNLAYKAKMPINWCLSCKIGLANEEVVDGHCERCGGPTEKREKEQWMLAITKYADRLDKDLDTVNFLEKIKIQQRNWIGRSEGSAINFKLKVLGQGEKHSVDIFTTRPDTLFGATFIAVSPEIAQKWINVGWQASNTVKKYIAETLKVRAKANFDEMPEKTGVSAGIWAINPGSEEEIPVWIVNYVLSDVGTGAIMGVPAHDERDFEFAKKYNLPIKHVVIPRRIDHKNPHVPGKEIIFRNAVIAVIKNPKDGKFLILKWKKQPWTTFVMGGMEEGEDPVRAAEREIHEETGYKNFKFVKMIGGPTQSEFYAAHKGVNRIAHTQSMLFELADEEHDELAPEEVEIHELAWVNFKEITSDIMAHIETDMILDRMNNGITTYAGEGIIINSNGFNMLPSEEAREKITGKFGKKVVKYKLRDWIFSRQRYWGEPIPLIHCDKCGWVAVPEKDLPVKLPEIKKYKPTESGESPLAAISKWVNVKCPKCKGKAKRETDTMPNWAGSSWYFLRYTDPKNKKAFAGKKEMQYFMPVDWYNGGMEHTVLHLLYSRFWHKFLYDIGEVETLEPYTKRTSHGLILAENGEKMSKSKGNIINPDDIVKRLGADSLRIYEMFMGPFDQDIAWSSDSIAGARRFIERAWKLRDKVIKSKNPAGGDTSEKLQILINQTIKKVSDDIEIFKMNTAISQLMILLNEFERQKTVSDEHYKIFLRLIAPFAPHFTEELWHKLGEKKSIQLSGWPSYDKGKLKGKTLQIAIQVNGKIRSTLTINEDQTEEAVKQKALTHPQILKWLSGKPPQKVIYVKGRIVSIVV